MPTTKGSGASRRYPFLRRFDIGARLFVSFCTVAGLTILATAVAWVLFGEVRRNLDIIAEESMTEIVSSFRLAQESAHLSTALPGVALATTESDLQREFRTVTIRLSAIETLTQIHEESDEDPHGLRGQFGDQVEAVRATVAQLHSTVKSKLAASRRREKLVSALFREHEDFLQAIDPLIDTARDEMIQSTRRSVTEGTAGISSLIDENFDALRSVLVVQSNIYLLILAIHQAAATDQLALVHDLRIAIVAPIAEIKGAFSQIADSELSGELRTITTAIIQASIGKDNIFALKMAVLRGAAGDVAVQEGRLLEQLAILDDLQTAFEEASGRATAAVDGAIIEAATEMSQAGQKMISQERQGVEKLETIILLRSEVNQLFGILSQAATAIERDDIEPLRRRYLALNVQIAGLLNNPQAASALTVMRPSVARILEFGISERSILSLRDNELAAGAQADILFRKSQRLDAELSESARVLVDTAEEEVSQATEVTLNELARGEVVLLIITILSLGAVVLIAWIVVLRGIVHRLRGLSSTMLAIADGRLDAPIPKAKWDDEITDMGEALKVFREDAVRRRKAERALREAKENAEQALDDLKAAQRRLVQAEKMASLGQLTAGIAHEIKNPLNFVNNFASLSRELIEELREQMDGVKDKVAPETREEIEDIFADLDLNLDKINEHGKRADGIVRGMLEHSRESSHGVEACDVNKLLEEYANLAYHGMRAQTTDFNVTIERDLDSDLTPIEIVAQDIGRVFLNIIANAFQAVYEKSQEQGARYDPKIFLSTRLSGDKLEVRIRDNGPGMPEEVLAKIFQPFFTTKPAGEGTGLGLSISYDIVVQQHGGSLEAHATAGEGTEFLIVLPLSPHHADEPQSN